MRLILTATDGSEGGGRAVKMAGALAAACGSRLVIITVEERATAEDKDLRKLACIEGGIGEARELVASNILIGAKEAAQHQGARAVETQQRWGDPAATILDAARELQADLIVVGRRGRGRLTGLVLGSVSQKLLCDSACAAMVVP